MDGLLVGLLSVIAILAYLVYYYYVRRLDITKKISAQPLMKSVHTVLFNGYFIEFFIHYFSKNVVVNSFAKTINWIDINIIDATVNVTVKLTSKIKFMFRKTHSGYASDNSGAMILGVFILLLALFIGGAS